MDHPSWCSCKSCLKRELVEERTALGRSPNPDPAVEAEFGPPPRIEEGRLGAFSDDPYEAGMERYRDLKPGAVW